MKNEEEVIVNKRYEIYGRDFINGGRVSSEIREILKSLKIPSEIVRKAGIAAYEAEMNVILYADKGIFNLIITTKDIQMIIEDEGKGIENIELAMQEGYSTATPEIREMGFGAGMGLPNIKKNSSEFNIKSKYGKGTRVYIKINLNEGIN